MGYLTNQVTHLYTSTLTERKHPTAPTKRKYETAVMSHQYTALAPIKEK